MNQPKTYVYGYTTGKGASDRFDKYLQAGPIVRAKEDDDDGNNK